MLSKALEWIQDVLDQHLKNRFALDETCVIINNLTDTQGQTPPTNKNKLVVSLINIEKESARPFYNRYEKLPGGQFADIPVSGRFNLDLMLSAGFDDYKEALKFLETGMALFQVCPCWDKTRFSNIPAGITRLDFETEKISYHQMQSLWTAMGAKYQPSIVYKVRMLTLNDEQVSAIVQPINQLANTATP
jgi:hypothetical protein